MRILIWAVGVGMLFVLREAAADIYMHVPRGSNDRNCERNVNRNNGNRLFDSQNNAKGGYACPRAVGDSSMGNEAGMFQGQQKKKMYYYEGTQLLIEWTNQHGCGGNAKAECNIVLQYMNECTGDPKRPDVFPYVKNKAHGDATQEFRSGGNIATPRDGIPSNDDDAATDTIPDNYESAIPNTGSTRRYGMHESWSYYSVCQHTERNRGLWTSDQRVRRNDRRGTRQNPNGNRRGLECPEERDYYPYWAPSPWIDIAVLTDHAEGGEEEYCIAGGDDYQGRNMTQWEVDHTVAQTGVRKTCGQGTLCGWYTRNSANVAPKGWCEAMTDVDDKLGNRDWRNRRWPGTREECEELEGYGTTFIWKEASLSDTTFGWRLPGVVCGKTPFSRTNQLGNAMSNTEDDSLNSNKFFTTSILEETRMTSVNANRYYWRLPSISDPDFLHPGVDPNTLHNDGIAGCFNSVVLRIRYNNSNADVPNWPKAANASNGYNTGWRDMVNSSYNAVEDDDANSPLIQDPYVYVGPAGRDISTNANSSPYTRTPSFLSLALNTNQYSRTFQDRSYTFSIVPRPSSSSSPNSAADTPAVPEDMRTKVIINFNGRGKRGNIVQTYPAVEYDFAPDQVVCKDGQYIHFQWTGSDYNPRRGCNNGEGGPPDPNNFISNNDNNNARADRMNLVPLEFMTTNVVSDLTGGIEYPPASTVSVQDMHDAHRPELLSYAPCAQKGTESQQELDRCYKSMIGLYYLRQDSNPLYGQLRGGRSCLTEDELDNISSKNVRETHPRNCAKLNAAIHPYFDGGLVKCSTDTAKLLSYTSSRNNNHSNRDQKAAILVVPATTQTVIDSPSSTISHFYENLVPYYVPEYGVIQSGDIGETSGASIRTSFCNDEANNNDGAANNNGASSCLTRAVFDNPEADILQQETFTIEEGDNDAKGDGNAKGCEEIVFFLTNSSSVEEKIGLAIGLLFVGAFAAWAGYYAYNRYQKKKGGSGAGKFSTGLQWSKTTQDQADNAMI